MEEVRKNPEAEAGQADNESIEEEVFGPEEIPEYPEDPAQDTEQEEKPEEKAASARDNKDSEIQRLKSQVEGMYILTGMLVLFLFILIMLPGNSLKELKPAKLTRLEPVKAERIVQEPERAVYPRRIYPPEMPVRADRIRPEAYCDMLQMQKMFDKFEKIERRYDRLFDQLERMDKDGDGVVRKEYRFKKVPGKLILTDEDGVRVYNF